MNIQPITTEHREKVKEIIQNEWGNPIFSRGKTTDVTTLPGFISFSSDSINGVITYYISDLECEIITLNSFEENKGIGTLLLHEVVSVAKQYGCHRLWLVTTNDNINAIRFYQKKRFNLVALHVDAIDEARIVKPCIPLIGMDKIPIKHELEFEMRLEQEQVMADEDVMSISHRIMEKHKKAYEVLAR